MGMARNSRLGARRFELAPRRCNVSRRRRAGACGFCQGGGTDGGARQPETEETKKRNATRGGWGGIPSLELTANAPENRVSQKENK